jgi:hypothetical protein
MKKWLILGLVTVVFVAQAITFDLTLAWNPNSAGDQVTSYSVYRADGFSGVFSKVVDVVPSEAPAYTFPGLSMGVYRFKVTANNVWGESDPSNEVNTPPGKAASPSGVIVRVTAVP